MFYTGQYALQSGLAKVLQLAFSTHEQFRWDPDQQKTKIQILDAYPLQLLKFPCIIISISGGPGLLRGIGDEFESVTTTEVSIDGTSYNQQSSEIFGGQLRLTAILDIKARSGYERAQIIDWCDLYLRHYFPEKLQREGVLIQDMLYGPQTQELLGSDTVFGTSLSITCLSSWRREVPISTSQTLNALCLTGVFTSLPNGATVGELFTV